MKAAGQNFWNIFLAFVSPLDPEKRPRNESERYISILKLEPVGCYNLLFFRDGFFESEFTVKVAGSVCPGYKSDIKPLYFTKVH